MREPQYLWKYCPHCGLPLGAPVEVQGKLPVHYGRPKVVLSPEAIAAYQAGASGAEIAAMAGLSIATVYRNLRAQGVINRRGRPTGTTKNLARDNAACEMYQAGAALEEVGQAFGVTRERIRQILVKNGITERHNGIASPHRIAAADKRAAAKAKSAAFRARVDRKHERIIDLYLEGKTYAAIAAEVGCAIAEVGVVRKRAGLFRIKAREDFTAAEIAEIVRRWPDREGRDELARELRSTVGSLGTIYGTHRPRPAILTESHNCGQSLATDDR